MNDRIVHAESLLQETILNLNKQECGDGNVPYSITEEKLLVLQYFVFGSTGQNSTKDENVPKFKEKLIQDLSLDLCIPLLRIIHGDLEDPVPYKGSRNLNMREKWKDQNFDRSEESINDKVNQSQLTRITNSCFSLLLAAVNSSEKVAIASFEICVNSILAFSKRFIEELPSGRALHDDAANLGLESNLSKGESRLIPINVAFSVITVIYKLDLETISCHCKSSLGKIEADLYKGISSMAVRNPDLFSHLLPVLRYLCHGFQKKPISDRLERIFMLMLEINKNSRNSKDPLPYAVICCIIDLYFPMNTCPEFDVKGMEEFWRLLQNGLLHQDPLTRKRTIFIFKRAIDSIVETCNKKDSVFSVGPKDDPIMWWEHSSAKELHFYWQSFFLLMETLCEKQTHIIMPVLSAFDKMISANTTKCLGCGHGYLHLSWLTTLLKKGFQHDSRNIVKWAVQTTLTLDLSIVPLLSKSNQAFVFEDLFLALGYEHLYSRESSLDKGEPPKLLNMLEDFFTRCKFALLGDQQKTFFQEAVQSLCSSNLGGIPFFYVSKALSSVNVEGFVTKSMFEVMRNAIACCISSFPIKVRRGICYCFTKIIFQNLDCSLVTPHDASSYVQLLLGTQHIVYGDPIWSLLINSTLNCTEWFKRNGSDGMKHSKLSLFQDIWHAIAGENVDDVMTLMCKESAEKCGVLFLWSFNTFVCLLQNELDNNELGLSTILEQSLNPLLSPLLDFIAKLKTNPYLSDEKVTKALEFCSILLKHVEDRQATMEENTNFEYHYLLSKNTEMFDRLLVETLIDAFHPLLDHIEVTLSSILHQPYVNKKIHVCFELQKSIFKVYKSESVRKLDSVVRMHFEKVFKSCKDFLPGIYSIKMDIGLWACMENLLFLAQNVTAVHVAGEERGLLSDMVQCVDMINLTSYASKKVYPAGIGKDVDASNCIRISRIISCLWETVLVFLKNKVLFQTANANTQTSSEFSLNVNLSNCNPSTLVSAIGETYDFVSSDDIHPLLKCLEILLPFISVSDPDRTVAAIDSTWRLFLEQDRRDVSYWSLLSSFTPIFFHPCLLLQSEVSLERVKMFWKEMFSIGEEKGGVFNAVTDYISEHWLKLSDGEAHVIFSEFTSLIVDALVFGPIYKRNLTVLRDAKNYISSYISGKLDDEDNRHDFLVRTKLIDFCLKFEMKYNGVQFIYHLVEKLVAKDEDMSARFRRYFGDSLVHRQKLRIWQAVLVFMDLYEVPSPEAMDILLVSLFEALYYDNQPSVRRLIEWVVVLLFERYPAHFDRLWQKILKGGESRVGILTSLIGIVHHLALLLDDSTLQPFIETAFSRLLRWTQVQHLQVKLHAQVVMENFWAVCERKGWPRTLEKFRAIKDCFSLTEANSSVVKHRSDLARSFFFSSFHALDHYSLETIFFKFLKLSGVTDDEWLDYSVFDFQNRKRLKSTDDLDVLSTYQDTESKEGNSDEGVVNENKDVQKKISPWCVLPPVDDPLFQETLSRMKIEGQSQLILCATLIDKTPNLGGLCRTCEIFGVNTLVLGSLKYLQDTTFKSLSVTSERWINIEQVLPRKLVGYLEEKKNEGYRIVGVEQTSESTSLEEYRFHEKTILLLGNEKEGIPVDIIQLVDDCVEIPQKGIIRSLNVHVSGAIMIWEYTRQRLKEQAN